MLCMTPIANYLTSHDHDKQEHPHAARLHIKAPQLPLLILADLHHSHHPVIARIIDQDSRRRIHETTHFLAHQRGSQRHFDGPHEQPRAAILNHRVKPLVLEAVRQSPHIVPCLLCNSLIESDAV